MTPAEIQARIENGLPDCRAEVLDTTGGGDHFEALVVSSAFSGKSMIDQHRLVYALFGQAMGREIHALALRTFTPDEWQKHHRPKGT